MPALRHRSGSVFYGFVRLFLGRIAVKFCNLCRKVGNLACQEELADDVTRKYGPEFFQQILVLEVRIGNPRQERLGLHLINVDIVGAAVGEVHGHLLDIGVAFRVDGPERAVGLPYSCACSPYAKSKRSQSEKVKL